MGVFKRLRSKEKATMMPDVLNKCFKRVKEAKVKMFTIIDFYVKLFIFYWLMCVF